MNQEAFLTRNKAELYQIYSDLYKEWEKNEAIIKNFVVSASNFILNNGQVTSNQRNQGNTISNSPIINEKELKVRSFTPKEIPEKTQNMVIGSSLVKNLVGDRTIPEDICIHDYRGSTTKEKTNVIQELQPKKMKTVLIQDGTNSILKDKSRSIDELFLDYEQLIETTDKILSPDNIVLMQVPPIRNVPKNNASNERIHNFNVKMKQFANEKNYDVANIYDLMYSMPNYNNLFYDDIHFHSYHGVPFLKNCILSKLLLTSNNMISFQQQNRSTNQIHRNFWKQSYNYMRGYY